MTSYYHHTGDGDVPTRTELANLARDTARFKKSKGRSGRNLIKGYVASILSRFTLSNSTTSTLLAFSLLGLATHMYA